MSEQKYLESFISDYNLEVLREQKEAEMQKEIYGQYTITEILEAVDKILNV